MKKRIFTFLMAVVAAIALTPLKAIAQLTASDLLFDIKATPSTLKPGDETTITVSFANYDATMEDLRQVNVTVEWDPSVFEYVPNSAVKILGGATLNTLDILSPNPQMGYFYYIPSAPIAKPSTVLFSFKLKAIGSASVNSPLSNEWQATPLGGSQTPKILISNALTIAIKAPLSGTATIDNTAPRIGDVLNGSLVGGNNTGTLSYQWKADGANVGTGSTYTVALTDLGKTITLDITSSVETGTITSAGTAAVLKKANTTTPAAPTVASFDHTSVTLDAIAGYEYSRDGVTTWQTSNVFTGLTPNTPYSFWQRVAATADTEPSAASASTPQTTASPPPNALSGTATISNTSPKIGDVLTGSLAGGNNTGTLSYEWVVGGVSTGAASTTNTYTVDVSDLGKTITLKITSSVETGTVTSPATAAVIKKSATTPTAPTVASQTATTVTLNTTAGYQYSMDGADWSNTTGNFTGLLPNTSYSFYQRVAETSDTYASTASPVLNVTTDKAALGGTVAITGSTKFGQVLTADVAGLTSSPSVTLGALTYQWMRGATNIGTNSATYLLVAADIGQTITVTVSAANCTGNIASSATAAIDKADGPAAPSVTGSYTGDGTTFTYTVSPTGAQYEYSSDGSIWQASNVFTGFTTASPATTFYVRVAETSTANAGTAGDTGPVTFAKLTPPTAPTLAYTVVDDPADTGNPAGQKDKLITITQVAGAEYSFDGGLTWSSTNTSGGNSYPYGTVNIAVRYATTATHLESAAATAAVNLANAEQPAPAAFTLTFTPNGDGLTFTATIPTVTGGEYSFDGVTFSAANTKIDCAANTSYTGYVRLAATPGFNASPVTSNTQTSPLLTVATPVISPAGGNFTGSQTVTITCTTSGAAIYYTTDGSTPAATSTPYTATFNITATTTVRAIAIAPGMTNSAVASVTYTLSTVTPPPTGTAPTITGPRFLTLLTDYQATKTDVYTITGSSPVTVVKKSGDDKITWNNTTKTLDIAAGLSAGSYTVILSATNSIGSAMFTFTLTVKEPVFWIELPASFIGGKVEVNPLYIAEAGETVTLTVTPNDGYQLASITVYDYNDSTIVVPLTRAGNTYTFTMPAHHIRITAVFKSTSVSVDEVSAGGLKAYVQNDVLYVRGLTPGTTYRVYNVLGVLIYQGVAAGDAETRHAISLPHRGVYVVTDGNNVVKIAN